MFIAMNRFQVIKGEEEGFEAMWKNRESFLHEVPGFVEFHLLRGPAAEDHTLYATHTVWHSQGDFEAWTRSEAFRKAHAGAGSARPRYIGPPRFEGFVAVQTVDAQGSAS
ncbi:antibiotic biosynthesis monooxygenase [Novosphingobium endophyticum]|uniref:Antibiotic biosynthesis monooxygenase n=1 Tax=Novosphingobium endophyticum TaxID=1955250 RepID=A0A916TS77_9SPHN|nr:antibiotic biosynthesis monooxygenase [Novosphingobium endophyticum]GGB95353.1 antibiotic biosynthesis monooxygenase [Novosphingobium endophyticum]